MIIMIMLVIIMIDYIKIKIPNTNFTCIRASEYRLSILRCKNACYIMYWDTTPKSSRNIKFHFFLNIFISLSFDFYLYL